MRVDELECEDISNDIGCESSTVLGPPRHAALS